MDGAFNHVGVGVGDIHAAIAFYRSAFGCRVLCDAFEVGADGPGGEEAKDVLGSRPFKRMLIAHLASPGGVGIELFQLIDPP
jgi:catechol 2,3-dioxygenase-like lactoylglutathione lyase family enzyme